MHRVVSFSHVSAAANLLRPGVGAGAKRWIIYLQGGGSCATADDCEKRYQQTPVYMSGATYTVGELPGIKSTDAGTNPDFWDATYVELQYCSSDLWSGDTAGNDSLPTSDLRRWHWRGRRIVAAVIDDLPRVERRDRSPGRRPEAPAPPPTSTKLLRWCLPLPVS